MRTSILMQCVLFWLWAMKGKQVVDTRKTFWSRCVMSQRAFPFLPGDHIPPADLYLHASMALSVSSLPSPQEASCLITSYGTMLHTPAQLSTPRQKPHLCFLPVQWGTGKGNLGQGDWLLYLHRPPLSSLKTCPIGKFTLSLIIQKRTVS